jgi:tetratricopeptide (TPR) repeat protein
MKRAHLRLIAAQIFLCGSVAFVGVQPAAAGALLGNESSPSAQSAKPKLQVQSKAQKLANPLNDLLDEAQRDIDNKNFEAAIAPLQKVIVDQPEFAYAHFQLAYVYTALKKTDEARAEYERTIDLDPKMAEAYLNLGLLFLDSNSPGSEPAFGRAVTPFRKAVELMPGQKQPLYLLAVAQERSGDTAAAEESFEALLRFDPNDYIANVKVGENLVRRKKLPEAEARYRHALEIYPNGPAALKELAECLDAQKKPEAAEAYRQYVARFPDVDARIRLIHLLMEQQQYDAALAELDRVPPVTWVPQGLIPPLESHKLRADIQIAQKKWDDSIATLQQALALAPNDAQLHGRLGRIFLQKRDFAAAEKELRVALRLDGKNLDYWKDLSSTFFLGGNYPAALATMDEIAKMEQPGAGVWFIRAICYDKLNQLKPALQAYQKFLELDQDKNPDQVWQAKERSKVLQRMLERRR